MLIFNSLLLGTGLAMDAFSVSLANGLTEQHMSKGKMTLIAGVRTVSGFDADDRMVSFTIW